MIDITANTIITPSAKDLAEEYGITFNQEAVNQCCSSEAVTKDRLFAILKQILTETNINQPLFNAEKHSNGLKVVHGQSVKMENFDTGNPSAKVNFQELISKDESQISAGFLEIDHSSFKWELTYEEIDYVIEGTLTIEIDGQTYTAQAGDVVFVPKNSKVVWGSPNKVRLFYATYPANWSDE